MSAVLLQPVGGLATGCEFGRLGPHSLADAGDQQTLVAGDRTPAPTRARAFISSSIPAFPRGAVGIAPSLQFSGFAERVKFYGMGERSADRRARRRLEEEMREWSRAGKRWVRVRVPRPDAETERLERQRMRQREKVAPVTSLSLPPRALPRYRAVIVDKAGRRGVFVDFIYDSASRNRFGVARRRVGYMFKDDHAELIAGQVHFLSNLGESYDEIIAAVTVAEAANRSAQKNAKVGTNAIYQFAADLDQAGRLREMKLLARKYDALGLALCDGAACAVPRLE